jgi:hypothetical protein
MGLSDLLGVLIGGFIGLAGSIVPHLWEKCRAAMSFKVRLSASLGTWSLTLRGTL